MLKRIHIRGYKSLINLDVKLEPLTLIFGPNAAGKSNFLDALQLLSRLIRSKSLKEAFEPPCRGTPLESFTMADDGIEGLLNRDSASFSIEVDVELSPAAIAGVNLQIADLKRTDATKKPIPSEVKNYITEKNIRYRIELEISPRSGMLRVKDEFLAALNSLGRPTGKRSAFLETVGNRMHLRMEGQAHPTYHDRYLDHAILSMPLYPPHYPHLVATRNEISSWLFFYFEPRERMRAATSVKEVRHIGPMGEELGSFLNTLKAADIKRFQGVERALRTIIPSVSGIDPSINKFGEVELRLIEGKMAVPARVLSEGTLRILGLLALSGAKEPPALIGFEEPENGIHPRRIRLIAELLKSRGLSGDAQIIATTHSPILPDLIPDECLFVCKRKGDHTTLENFRHLGELYRSQAINTGLSDEDAKRSAEDQKVSARIARGDFD